MSKSLSVIIATYNPDSERLRLTLNGLLHQSLPKSEWELILVDNNSNPKIQIDLTWHPNYRLEREPKPGLTNARLKGFQAAEGRIIVMVDDDNVLDKDYLRLVLQLFDSDFTLGAIGGKVIPVYEIEPPLWITEFLGNLALRDLGDKSLVGGWEKRYPDYAPIGAGMSIRKDALSSYLEKIKLGHSLILDRTGNQLTSGGDNDIVLEILKSGWQIGYFPTLVVQHLIPRQRLEPAYLGRLNNNISRSWIAVLENHRINPWRKIPVWSVRFRKMKAWLTFRAWRSEVNYIKWQGACGMFDGLAELRKKNGQT